VHGLLGVVERGVLIGRWNCMRYGKSPKVYVKFGIAILATMLVPACADALPANSIISSQIGSTIGLFTTSGTVNINAAPTGAGVQTVASDTVTVSTNSPTGYTLSLSESTAESSLISGANSIPTSTGTQVGPIAMTANSWGYRVDGVGGFGAAPTLATSNVAISTIKFASVPIMAAPDTLKTTATTATNDTTKVWYAVAANTTAQPGTYTNTVTYTAITN
jgi:hypothetical protein